MLADKGMMVREQPCNGPLETAAHGHPLRAGEPATAVGLLEFAISKHVTRKLVLLLLTNNLKLGNFKREVYTPVLRSRSTEVTLSESCGMGQSSKR